MAKPILEAEHFKCSNAVLCLGGATSRPIGILLTLNFNVILICGDAILASAAQKLHIWVVFSEIVRVGREVRRPPSEFAYFGTSAPVTDLVH